MALVLGMFVVFQTLSQSLVERLKQIGLLRCLGATRRTIAGIFLLDALALSLIGAVLGVSESRACQLHGQALVRLRARLRDWHGAD